MSVHPLSRRLLIGAVAAVVLAGVLSAPAAAAPPPAAAAAADCPRVLFLGAHGVQEGGAGGGQPGVDRKDLEKYWGRAVQSTWEAFVKLAPDAQPLAGDYPYIDQTPAGLFNQFEAVRLANDRATDAAKAMEEQLIDHHLFCAGTTRYVLVGFSFGAWAINKLLHNLHTPNASPQQKLLFEDIAAVGLMGDPSTPGHYCPEGKPYPEGCRMGIVNQWSSEWGYLKWEDYLSHNLGDDFQFRCLSYSNEQVDGICGSYNLGQAISDESQRLHNTYDETKVTDELASVLYTRVFPGVG